MLSVDHVTKKFGKDLVLEDITLDFESGVYGLLAPNGAGKTTLIKMLTTLLLPTEGEIRWKGTDIFALGASYRAVLGYLPQQFGYYRDNSPRQFLSYLSALKGLDPKEAERRIELLLETVGLRDAADKKMKKFSGGMLQRAGIAAAMLNDPQILILDEPTAGLDPCERVRFRNLIHSLSQDRIVILSTHIVSDIETIASKIVMLRDHRLYCCKTPQEVCGALRGKVFEVPSGTALNVPYQFLSERQSEHGTVLRIACETMPGGGTPVTPNLEDMFLYVYGEQEGTGHEPSAV